MTMNMWIPANEWIPARKQKPKAVNHVSPVVLGVIENEDGRFLSFVYFDGRDGSWFQKDDSSNTPVRVVYWTDLPNIPERIVAKRKAAQTSAVAVS